MGKPIATNGKNARSPLARPLADAARASGLSASALATRAGLDRRIVARFMAGSRDLRLETADRLAAALGLRLGWAAGRRPRIAETIPSPPLATTPTLE